MRAWDDHRAWQLVGERVRHEGIHRPRRSPLLVIGNQDAQQANPSTLEPPLDGFHTLPLEAFGVPRYGGDLVAECNEVRVEFRKRVVILGDAGVDRLERRGIEVSRERGNHGANIRDAQVSIEADHPESAPFTSLGEQEKVEVVPGFDDHLPSIRMRLGPRGRRPYVSGVTAPPRNCGRLQAIVRGGACVAAVATLNPCR